MTITSLDFETANHSRASVCAAGLTVLENGQNQKDHEQAI